MAVSQWGLQPTEFWAMTPQEWWHIYEAKHGVKTKRYGNLSHDEADSLFQMVEGIKNGASR